MRPWPLAACQDHARPSRAARVGAGAHTLASKAKVGARQALPGEQTYPTPPNRVRRAWYARASPKCPFLGVFAGKHALAECETHLWRRPQLLAPPLLEAHDAGRGVAAADAELGTLNSGMPGARLPARASSTCKTVGSHLSHCAVTLRPLPLAECMPNAPFRALGGNTVAAAGLERLSVTCCHTRGGMRACESKYTSQGLLVHQKETSGICGRTPCAPRLFTGVQKGRNTAPS